MIFADSEVFVIRYAPTLKRISSHIVKGRCYLSLRFLLDFFVQMSHDSDLIFLEKAKNFIQIFQVIDFCVVNNGGCN